MAVSAKGRYNNTATHWINQRNTALFKLCFANRFQTACSKPDVTTRKMAVENKMSLLSGDSSGETLLQHRTNVSAITEQSGRESLTQFVKPSSIRTIPSARGSYPFLHSITVLNKGQRDHFELVGSSAKAASPRNWPYLASPCPEGLFNCFQIIR